MPRKPTGTQAADPSPSVTSTPTTSTEPSPPIAEIPSESEQPAPESTPAPDAETPDYRHLLERLTLAVERYSLGIGHWDDVVLTADEAQSALRLSRVA